LCVLVAFLCGCSGETHAEAASSDTHRETKTTFLTPTADGTVTQETDTATLDASHQEDGYITVCYTGQADAVRVQITDPQGVVYTYPVPPQTEAVLPLSGGDGAYHVTILEHAYDDLYALCLSWDTEVTITDEFTPFLYPNLYCWYTADSQAVQYGITLSEESADDLDYVERVYHYVTENIEYDTDLAANAPLDYLPDIDQTMETGKGICFDYAALMTAQLRSQGIPTKLEVGYSGQAYHAWISVYLEEKGWVDNIISFDGNSWSLMDPTLAASNSAASVKKYVGDGSNYTVKYHY
jgi:transglutaminase-like putative cysteine protease